MTMTMNMTLDSFLDPTRLASLAVSDSFSPQLAPDIKENGFDITRTRQEFPILSETVNGKPLIWLDNAATTQKPKSVINRLVHYYEHENSNIHRGAHVLADRSTAAYEDARNITARFLGASSSDCIVFVRGATEAVNLVAQSYGKHRLREDDEVVVSWLEHHANIVPWQMLCEETGAKLRVIPVNEHGEIILSEYERLLNRKTKIVSFVHISNVLGTVTPAAEMINMAHRYGARVLVDGAQAAAHLKIDVRELDCDFYIFSGHKAFGPTGIGVLYGKAEVLNEMYPYQGGGNMISDVSFEKTLYRKAPHRFEAGTGNIAGAVGLGAALEWLDTLGQWGFQHEHQLLEYAEEEMLRIPGLSLLGHAREKSGALSFVIDGISSEEVGRALNKEGIAVRAGHHCAQPILRRYGLDSCVRASLAVYNTKEEVNLLVEAIRHIPKSSMTSPSPHLSFSMCKA